MRIPLLVSFLLLTSALMAQREHAAVRIDSSTVVPVVDGLLDEPLWMNVQPATDFIQNSPQPGKPSRQKTEVRILYTDEAIYLGARMFDASPDSILHQLGPRDEYTNNTDAFGVMFDTYHDKRNAFFFAVTAAGVQTDARFVFDKADLSLNAVWYSKVNIDSLGWTVEMKIPYQAIRFPKQDRQTWGVNYTRITRRYREQSWWSTVDPNISGVVNQCGDLTGISGIQPPLRLALFPYVSGYYQLYDGNATRSINGGLDLKYGLNESFTLDMTLVPDFGQTLSDNLVLNLSPFEVKYDERRYFFTEGTELFNRNDLFYSRRIGAQPAGYYSVTDQLDSNEQIVSNPLTTRLYNAIKLSGRTRKKTGIGLFNAVAAPAYAEVKNTVTGDSRDIKTAPLTNYNCFVAEQIIGANSYIGYMNTTVFRSGDEGNDAIVNSVQFRAADAKNHYAMEGYADYSYVGDMPGHAGAGGLRYHIEGGKVKGPLIAKLRHHLVQNTFNCNDMGYLDRNDYYNFGGTVGYNVFTPHGRYLWMINEVNLDASFMYRMNARTFFTVTGRHIFTFRNFLTVGANWLLNPIVSHDFFETRTYDRYLLYPRNYELGGFLSSDYRKTLALDLTSSYRIFLERNRSIFRYSISPRWRVSDNFFVVYKWEQEIKHDNVGYVGTDDGDIIFGLRDLNTVTSTLTCTYIFTPRMGVALRVRHYWSEVDYRDYFVLKFDGSMGPYAYWPNADISFNAFNIDLIYTWQFLPGSELSIAWKNSILSNSSALSETYINDLSYVFDFPQNNSFSVKMIWYIDAGRWMSRKH